MSRERWDATYTLPWQIALRERSAVCVDDECSLSGGYAHAGDCVPCACGEEHAEIECPVSSPRDLLVPSMRREDRTT